MESGRRIAAVVNPRAAGGKAASRWGEISRALETRLGSVNARFTQHPGHGIELARALLHEGYERIIAVGGDGTINEVANGFVENDQPVRPGATLGILPMGLGGDFQRTLGIGSKLDEALSALSGGALLTIDVGKVVFLGNDGAKQTRYFVNLISFGMGGEVASRAKNLLSPINGTAAFLWATLRTFIGYRGSRVRMELDGEQPRSFFITNIAVGNGQYHGGGMHPCPTAVLNDGLLEVTVVDYLGFYELIRDLRVLYSDKIYYHPKVHHFRARKIVAEADQATCLEIDGEPLGTLPLEITVLPQKISVLVPASSSLLSRER